MIIISWTTSWWGVTRGHSQCYSAAVVCGLWLNNFWISTFLKNFIQNSWHHQHQKVLELFSTYLNFLKPYQWSRLDVYTDWRSVIYCYESVPVPPMPPEVPTRNPVVPVCHMAQELYVMVELCVLLFMWWPRGCGWNSRLSLQSIDYPCSLRLYCVCKDFTKY